MITIMTITTKSERVLFFAILFLVVLLIGGIMNNIVIEENNCKMPVLGVENYLGDKHINFEKFDEVNYAILADIIGIKGKIMFSIGDVFLIIAALGSSFMLINFWVILQRKIKEIEK